MVNWKVRIQLSSSSVINFLRNLTFLVIYVDLTTMFIPNEIMRCCHSWMFHWFALRYCVHLSCPDDKADINHSLTCSAWEYLQLKYWETKNFLAYIKSIRKHFKREEDFPVAVIWTISLGEKVGVYDGNQRRITWSWIYLL